MGNSGLQEWVSGRIIRFKNEKESVYMFTCATSAVPLLSPKASQSSQTLQQKERCLQLDT